MAPSLLSWRRISVRVAVPVSATWILVSWVYLSTGALSQDATFRILDETPDGQTIEVSVAWPLPLAAALDSARAAPGSDRLVFSVSGGLYTASTELELPALAAPFVEVRSAEYDEVGLPQVSATARALPDAGGALATVGVLGLMRKRPVGTLSVHLFTFDPARETLRRYRRLIVTVRHPAIGAGKTTAHAYAGTSPHLAVRRSALAEGMVFRISIREEGIYRIDRALLAALGIDPARIDPANVHVFGNGGAPLPARNDAPRPADVLETPVFIEGGGDGSFGASDAVYFYAKGPRGWRYDAAADAWAHYVHPFSNENAYFLKIDGLASVSLATVPYADLPGAQVADQVTGRYVVDRDDYMWSKEHGTGHTWVSVPIRVGSRLPILENVRPPGFQGGAVTYRARVAARSTSGAAVLLRSGGATLAEVRPGSVGSNSESPIARAAEATFTQDIASGARLNLDLALQSTGEAEAALDWLRVSYAQVLQAEGGVLRFATPAGNGTPVTFALRGFTEPPSVWDVTAPEGVTAYEVKRVNDAFHVQLGPEAGSAPRELIAFSPSTVRSLDPAAARRVTPQNLHGIETYPAFVIVTPDTFAAVAAELADLRRREGLVTEVVRVEQIYNEFSGGVPDMRALRDYLKFLYDRASTEADLLRYVLLFGDGHYNFRNLGTLPENRNWIFPYETEESFDPIRSYTSDDYFGLLDDAEGEWAFGSSYAPAPPGAPTERVDVGIGRLPVQTPAEAAAVVMKIRHYEDAASYGDWRMRYTFVADDGPTGLTAAQNDLDLHVQNADVVAELVRRQASEVNVEKIYALSYPRAFLNGWRIPGARQDLLNALRTGTLAFNYAGHGGPTGLAQEDLFNIEDARALDNLDALPLFVTATCSFGWWDLDRDESGAEALVLNARGGAIAAFTTVRLVYTSPDSNSLNVGLNRALNQELLRREQGLPRRLGDVLRATKNTRAGLEGNSRKFGLLGDPTLRLGLPSYGITIEALNDSAIVHGRTTLSALDRVTLTGSVRTPAGDVASAFDGTAELVVFDAARDILLPYRAYMPTPYYRVRKDLLWRGAVPVRAGRFSAQFVVPKDISYSNAPGRIAAYARSAALHAAGANEHFVVGGTAGNVQDDARGPEIALFLDDTTFVSGGLTHARPELIVHLFDETGLNTVSAGVGHELLLVVDGDEQAAVDLSRRFRGAEGDFRRGQVRFSFEAYPKPLEPGPHERSADERELLDGLGYTARAVGLLDRYAYLVKVYAAGEHVEILVAPVPRHRHRTSRQHARRQGFVGVDRAHRPPTQRVDAHPDLGRRPRRLIVFEHEPRLAARRVGIVVDVA